MLRLAAVSDGLGHGVSNSFATGGLQLVSRAPALHVESAASMAASHDRAAAGTEHLSIQRGGWVQPSAAIARRPAQVAARRSAPRSTRAHAWLSAARAENAIGGLLGGRLAVEAPRAVGVLGLAQPLARALDHAGAAARRASAGRSSQRTEHVRRGVQGEMCHLSNQYRPSVLVDQVVERCARWPGGIRVARDAQQARAGRAC